MALGDRLKKKVATVKKVVSNAPKRVETRKESRAVAKDTRQTTRASGGTTREAVKAGRQAKREVKKTAAITRNTATMGEPINKTSPSDTSAGGSPGGSTGKKTFGDTTRGIDQKDVNTLTAALKEGIPAELAVPAIFQGVIPDEAVLEYLGEGGFAEMPDVQAAMAGAGAGGLQGQLPRIIEAIRRGTQQADINPVQLLQSPGISSRVALGTQPLQTAGVPGVEDLGQPTRFRRGRG